MEEFLKHLIKDNKLDVNDIDSLSKTLGIGGDVLKAYMSSNVYGVIKEKEKEFENELKLKITNLADYSDDRKKIIKIFTQLIINEYKFKPLISLFFEKLEYIGAEYIIDGNAVDNNLLSDYERLSNYIIVQGYLRYSMFGNLESQELKDLITLLEEIK